MDKILDNNYISVWFMRQAGRYLPEYKKIRQTEKSFIDLCFNSEKSATISLQPIERFDFDYIILFSDILVIPHALGQQVTFKENIGPLLNPINSLRDLGQLNIKESLQTLDPVFETIKLIKKKKANKDLIGFCGGAFTVLTYMIQGGSSKDHLLVKEKVKKEKLKLLEIIEVLVEISSLYLNMQIKSGANRVMIFESWAGLLEGQDYIDFIIKPTNKLIDKVKKKYPKIPIVTFPRGSGKKILDFIDSVPCNVISLDKTFPKKILKIANEKNITLQGNLDPLILVEGGKRLDEEVKKILLTFKENKHIFNLSHGILPITPIENVIKTLKIITSFNETR